ncbi:bis-aminopropyl spermidine synthase family protein [bacterium]|nr:bis-aminopropyl spermidine synthase family protein [bacterium]
MKEILANLQKRVDINERQLERLLEAFVLTNDFWEAIAISRLPFNTVVEASRQLYSEGIISFEDAGRVVLTEKGKSLIDIEKYPPSNYICESCKGRGVSLEQWQELLEDYRRTVEGRPEPLLEYDQGYLTIDSTIARVAFADGKGDIRKRRIIILGDDDLLSLALGLSRLPEKITVLEIDQRLIEFIERVAKERKLNIEVLKHDLRNPLPSELLGKFDTFFTDPVETLKGLEVFMARGIASLKGEGCAGYFGLTTAESSFKKWRDIEKLLLNEFGVLITDILSDFSLYENWDYLLDSIKKDLPPLQQKPEALWYRSSLFRIELLEGYKVSNEEGQGEIYLDEESIAWSGRENR